MSSDGGKHNKKTRESGKSFSRLLLYDVAYSAGMAISFTSEFKPDGTGVHVL